MGFTLTLGPIKSVIRSNELASVIQSFLASREIDFIDNIDPATLTDPFFLYDSSDAASTLGDESASQIESVYHAEVGWSFWLLTQNYMLELLGEAAIPNALNIHAWTGAAVPGQIEPLFLGDPVRRRPASEATADDVAMIEGIPESERAKVAYQFALAIEAYGGPLDNFFIVSGYGLLAEFEAAIEKAGLVGVDPMELYEKLEDVDERAYAQCFLVMAHKFLAFGMRHKHLVWWNK